MTDGAMSTSAEQIDTMAAPAQALAIKAYYDERNRHRVNLGLAPDPYPWDVVMGHRTCRFTECAERGVGYRWIRRPDSGRLAMVTLCRRHLDEIQAARNLIGPCVTETGPWVSEIQL